MTKHRPEVLLVYGDVNSTMAATLVAAKLGVPVAHVEAGLRSGDRSMPEEINRLVTDRLAQWLLTPSADGEAQLRQFDLSTGNGPRPFVLVTLHRPSNVDEPEVLARLMAALENIARQAPVIFPVHPRTRERIARFSIPHERTVLSEPLTYLPFLGLQRHAAVVVTDSGGIQEETTYLGIPCLTMRANTERPITVTIGTNQLLGHDTDKLQREVQRVLDGNGKKGSVPELWDGHAGERIADVLTGT